MKCQKATFALTLACMLMLSSALYAQEASSEEPNNPESVAASVIADGADELASELESSDEMDVETESGETEIEELDEDELDEDELDEDELDEDELDEDELDEDELDEDGADDYENSPISVRVNQYGELIGQAQASVSGNWLPVEANIAIVSEGVLLGKIVADTDGSFAFPNIAPGNYNVYGTASSFCGRRAVTVLPERGCCDCGEQSRCDSVGLNLTQDSQGTCYADLGSAPAATFSGGPSPAGGFAGQPIASGAGGGGVAAGGGVARGISGLRLLAIGGTATAIALGVSDDDDDASPSN